MSPRLHEHVRALLSTREAELRAWGRVIAIVFGTLVVVLVVTALSYSYAFGPAGVPQERPEFVISPGETLYTVATRLEDEGLVKYAAAFRFAYGITRGERTLRPGGYELSPGMDALQIAKKLGEAPYLTWVSIPEGRRKEEVADILRETLGWTAEERQQWLVATEAMPDMTEGVFFPDTYLIPSDQPPSQVVARLRGRFEDAVAPYAVEALEEGKEWKEVITLASLIEREAGRNDKRLVAGILYNRLEKGMPLQVDATLQYVAGKDNDWWPIPDVEVKDVDSPFNTYVYKGLPPEPIATPSLDSIEAALTPQSTKCLYYLHDAYGRIHCATTYAAHKANVNRYLR